MESGSRRRHATVVAGENRLVAFAVMRIRRTLDVGRERHGPVALHQLCRRQTSGEVNAPQPSTDHLGDLGSGIGPESHRASHFEFPPRMHHRQPGTVRLRVDEEDFGLAVVVAQAFEAGRHDATHVEHQHVAGLGELGDVAKGAVLDFSRRAVQNEQAAGASVGKWPLRNGLSGVLVVEVGCVVAARHSLRRRRNSPGRWRHWVGCSRSACRPPVSRRDPAVCGGGIPAE